MESRNVVFLENESFSGRIEPKDPSNGVATPIWEYGVTREATHEGNETIPTVQVPLQRSQREKRHAISSDYEVYLRGNRLKGTKIKKKRIANLTPFLKTQK